ncbi:MAG: family 10 glycosylhydrolase [Verrucomicrobiota bacterium]
MSESRSEIRWVLGLAILLALGPKCLAADYIPVFAKVPEPRREMRAAWVATVHNIDWPSKPGLSGSQQRAELTELLNVAAETGLNAVILQVRTECDALYPSKIEPWSFWLSGQMGRAPSDGYDPLAFAIQEAHRRGIELHAWFNPFRSSATSRSTKSRDHISRTHSSLMLPADSMVFANPASDYSQQRALAVIKDVVSRYAIDGVHLDDYFYPYPKAVNGRRVETFNDSKFYQAYRSGGGQLDARSWRRSEMDSFIRDLYGTVKSTKRHVDVGISPFGIWRPGVPRTIEAGVDAYEHLAADSRKWLREGWLDYFSPQLYWRISPAKQSFTTLYNWWSGENVKKRHFFPGIASSRVMSSTDRGRPASEMTNQIEVTRKRPSPLGAGHLHWSIDAILTNQGGLRDRLRSTYAEVAIPPASPWLGSAAPSPAYVAVEPGENGGTMLYFKETSDAQWRLIQVREGRKWTTLRLLPASIEGFPLKNTPDQISVRHVSATGMLSVPTVFKKR